MLWRRRTLPLSSISARFAPSLRNWRTLLPKIIFFAVLSMAEREEEMLSSTASCRDSKLLYTISSLIFLRKRKRREGNHDREKTDTADDKRELCAQRDAANQQIPQSFHQPPNDSAALRTAETFWLKNWNTVRGGGGSAQTGQSSGQTIPIQRREKIQEYLGRYLK